LGTVSKFKQCFMGSNWTALKLTAANTCSRGLLDFQLCRVKDRSQPEAIVLVASHIAAVTACE